MWPGIPPSGKKPHSDKDFAGIGKCSLLKSDLISESKATVIVSAPMTILQPARKFYLI